MKNFKEIINLLKKHEYIVKLVYDTDNEKIFLQIPAKHDLEKYDIIYKINHNKILWQNDPNEEPIELDCPTYACRIFIFTDVRRICEYIGFDTRLIEFYVNQDKINEEGFFQAIWPSSLKLTKEIKEQEKKLMEIITKAVNCIMPYAEKFTFNAHQAGVGVGYSVIRTFMRGDIDNE
jgi:hypothetical protein